MAHATALISAGTISANGFTLFKHHKGQWSVLVEKGVVVMGGVEIKKNYQKIYDKLTMALNPQLILRGKFSGCGFLMSWGKHRY